MNRPPRQKDERLFTRKTLFLSLLQGFVVLAVVFIVYLHAISRGLEEAEVRTLTFTTIVIANLLLILTNRSWSETMFRTIQTPNKAMGWVFAGTLIGLALILFIPELQDLFRFAPISIDELITCVLAGVVSILWFEVYKVWNARRKGEEKAFHPVLY